MDKQSLTRLQRQLTGKYVATNGLFWMAYVCIWGFGAVYLKGKGFSSTETGIITALGGLISVVFQPLLAARMENGGRLSVRQAFMLCLGAACICDVVLLVCPAAAALALACLFLAVMALFQMNSAVLNSLGMEYVNLGIPVNYGLARGAGSVCFALLSLALGFVTERFGVDALIVLSLVFSLCLIGLLATYQSTRKLKEMYGLGSRVPEKVNSSSPQPEDSSHPIDSTKFDADSSQKAEAGNVAPTAMPPTENLSASTTATTHLSATATPASEIDSIAARRTREQDASVPSPGMRAMFAADRGLLILLLGFFLIFVGHFMNNTYMIDLVGRFGGSDADMGIATAFAASLELPAMILVNFLVKRISSANVLRISAVSYVMKTVILLGAVNMPVLLLSQLCQFGAYAFFVPASVYYINERVPDQYKVTGQSALGMATMGLGGAVGNFLGGRVQDVFGVSGMVVVCVTCTIVGAMFTFAGLGKNHAKN